MSQFNTTPHATPSGYDMGRQSQTPTGYGLVKQAQTPNNYDLMQQQQSQTLNGTQDDTEMQGEDVQMIYSEEQRIERKLFNFKKDNSDYNQRREKYMNKL